MNPRGRFEIAVVGLGKIGLPLATQFARKGFKVNGVDTNQSVVDAVNDGIAPFPGERDLDFFLKAVVQDGLLSASLDTEYSVSKSKVVVVAVPLYVDSSGVPDFRNIDGATELIGKGLERGSLVSYETTLPIGTTRKRFVPLLEQTSKLSFDHDFFVVFSPERVMTGRIFEDLKKYPKLVGGVSEASELRGVEFYESVLDFDLRLDLDRPNGVWSMGSSEASEFAKLAETTYRDVNIALANQFALFAQNIKIDISKVISASNSQPFSHIHRPGIAVGGHCIPIYPQMYLSNDPSATVVRSAREANVIMPEKCVDWLEKIHGSLQGQRVVVLGASYRGGVKETAFSGVFPVVEHLKARGATVSVHDPMYTDAELESMGFEAFHFGHKVDAIVVQSDHDKYTDLSKDDFPGAKTVLDGRGILNESKWEGVAFHLLGRG